MYAVVDLNQIASHENRHEAEQYLEALRTHNPAAEWQLVVHVKPQPINALERLYSLAGILLQQSGVNPFALTLTEAQLDGSEVGRSAVAVMNEARAWIDQLHNSH